MIKMFKKKDNRPKTQKIILKEFPIISITDVEKIDYNIKSRTSLETISLTHTDFSKVVSEEITKYYKCSNADKFRKKCNRIAACYKANGRVWLLQENWFCLLAYLIMIATMICRVLELETRCNDITSFYIYIVAAVIWCCIVGCEKLMGEKAEKFLDAFNHQAPSLVIIVSIIFYMWMSFAPAKSFGGSCIIVGSIVACLFFTLHWYYRSKK